MNIYNYKILLKIKFRKNCSNRKNIFKKLFIFNHYIKSINK